MATADTLATWLDKHTRPSARKLMIMPDFRFHWPWEFAYYFNADYFRINASFTGGETSSRVARKSHCKIAE